VATGSTLTLTSGLDKDIVGRSIENFGTVIWAGGRIRTGNGTQFLNHGLWEIQTDQIAFNSDFGGAMSVFVNDGTFRKSAGAGTTFFDISFVNSTLVEILAGTILFRANVSSNASTFRVASGTLIGFSNAGYTFNDNTTFEGAGAIRITSGGVTFAGTIHSANLEYAGGNLGGTFSLDGTLLWTGGQMLSPGAMTVTTGSTLTLASGLDKDVVGRSIENFGTVIWAGGRIRTGSGTQFLNHGLWEIQTDQIAFNSDFGGTMSVFVNDGTLRKSAGGGTTFFDITLVNSALVDVISGTILFRADATSNAGTFRVASNTQIGFGNSGYTFNNNTRFEGSGAIRVTGGGVTLAGTIHSANLEYTGGNLAGTFTLDGTLLWTGGQMLNPGVMTVAPGSTLTIASGLDKDIVGRSIENFGTVIWAGGRMRTGNGTQFVNHGLWEIQTDQIAFNSDFGGTQSSFLNSGILRKTAGSGASQISINFENT
jgi:hypothetical protein